MKKSELTNKKKLDIVRSNVERLYLAKLKFERAKRFYEDVKKKETVAISNFMFTNFPKYKRDFEIDLNDGSYFFYNPIKVKLTKIEGKRIIFDSDKLRKKLDKNIMRKIERREYSINDIDSFKKYLKSIGAEPKEFLKYIDIKSTIDNDEIDRLFDTGKISREDIEGCYTVKENEPYFRFSEIGSKDDT